MRTPKWLSSVEIFDVVRDAIRFLPHQGRIYLKIYITLQLLVSILDMLALVLVGLVTTLGMAFISGNEKSIRIILPLDNYIVFESQVKTIYILGLISLMFFFIRTFLTLLLTSKMLERMAVWSSEISSILLKELLQTPYSWLRKQNIDRVAFNLTQGVQYGVLGVIGQFGILVSESFLAILILVLLFIVNPVMALTMFLIFGLFSIFVYLKIGKGINVTAELVTEGVVSGNFEVRNMINLFREIFVLKRSDYFIEKFKNQRLEASKLYAKLNWLQLIPKYAIESAMLLGGLLITVASFYTSSATQALTALVIFLVASARVMPSALRIQQAMMLIHSYAGTAQSTYTSRIEMQDARAIPYCALIVRPEESGELLVSLQNIEYKYPGSQNFALVDVNLEIASSGLIGLTGPSGSGKSTLCEILLRVTSPSAGKLVHHIEENEEFRASYLPQDIFLLPDTVIGNIAIGLVEEKVDLDQVWVAIERAQLLDFVNSLPQGIYTKLSNSEIGLSGGERQRIGLARALYSNPMLLILDESTNSLDRTNEQTILKVLKDLSKEMSIILITHNAQTFGEFDRTLFMEDGKIKNGSLND
jgi:ABC-type multidrug transport system fused ATPase/permease subunit